MTNKENNYILTTFGFRRVPLSADLKQQKRITLSTKHLQGQKSNVIKTNQYKRNEILVTQYPTSYLDRKWQYNAQRTNLVDRPKSVSQFSSTDCIMPINNLLCDSKLLKRRAKSAEPIKYHHSDSSSSASSDQLNHEDLTIGQKKYLHHIAKCYSVQQLKELAKERMKCVLDYEFMKRYITSDVPDKVKINLWKEYCDYRMKIDQPARKRHLSCSSYSPTHSQSRRQSSKSFISVINEKPDIKVLVTTEEDDGKSVLIEDTDLLNGHGEEKIKSYSLNGQVQGEVSFRRVRPKSAKYQKRGTNVINPERRALSRGSSQEDELVFSAEEKLSVFENVLMDNITDSSTT